MMCAPTSVTKCAGIIPEPLLLPSRGVPTHRAPAEPYECNDACVHVCASALAHHGHLRAGLCYTGSCSPMERTSTRRGATRGLSPLSPRCPRPSSPPCGPARTYGAGGSRWSACARARTPVQVSPERPLALFARGNGSGKQPSSTSTACTASVCPRLGALTSLCAR